MIKYCKPSWIVEYRYCEPVEISFVRFTSQVHNPHAAINSLLAHACAREPHSEQFIAGSRMCTRAPQRAIHYWCHMHFGHPSEATSDLVLGLSRARGSYQGTLTFRRYTQREFKLKFSVLLKAYDGKYTQKGKKITF